MILAAKLRTLINHANEKAVADALGRPVRALDELTRGEGERHVQPLTVIRLAKVLGVDAEWLADDGRGLPAVACETLPAMPATASGGAAC